MESSFETQTRRDGYGYTIELRLSPHVGTVGFYTGYRTDSGAVLAFGVSIQDGAWDDFVTMINYVDQMIIKAESDE